MKKATRRILSLCMAIAMCTTLALTAYAGSASNDQAGIYVVLDGEATQDTVMPHLLHTTTSVVRNPNGACLKTEMECYRDDMCTLSGEAVSEAGVKIYPYDFEIWVELEEFQPTVACTNHRVVEYNDEGDEVVLYSAYTYTSLTWSTTGLIAE